MDLVYKMNLKQYIYTLCKKLYCRGQVTFLKFINNLKREYCTSKIFFNEFDFLLETFIQYIYSQKVKVHASLAPLDAFSDL